MIVTKDTPFLDNYSQGELVAVETGDLMRFWEWTDSGMAKLYHRNNQPPTNFRYAQAKEVCKAQPFARAVIGKQLRDEA